LQITGISWNDGDQGVFQFSQAEMWIIHTLASGHCEPRIERLIVRGAAKVVKQPLDCFLRKGAFPREDAFFRCRHCEPHAGRFMWEVHYSGEAVSGDCFAAHQSWFLRLLRRLAKTGEKLMIFLACCLLLNNEQNAEVCDATAAA